MAKKSSIEQNKLKQRLVLKYSIRRNILKAQIKKRFFFGGDINSSKEIKKPYLVIVHPLVYILAVFLTGRPRAVYRDFGLSRHVIREMAHTGLLPGVTKSSW